MQANPVGAPAESVALTDGELLGLFTATARNVVGDSTGSAKARARSEAAFQQLIERHGPMVWGVCLQILGDQQEAEDAFQASFLVLSRHASKIRASESAAGWLYRVARHTALAARRKAQKRKESRMETEPHAPPEEAFPDLAGREAAGVLMEELAAIPTKYRTPLVLQYFEGCSRSKIADLTDTTVATVQGRIARGKSMLRSRLLRRGVSFSAAVAIVAGGEGAFAASSTVAGAGFAHLISITASNATAVATGGSITASSALTLLYKEAVSVVGVNATFKLAIAAVVGVLLLVGAAFSATRSDLQAADSEPFVLQAKPLNEDVREPFAVEIDLQPSRSGEGDHAAATISGAPRQTDDALAGIQDQADLREGGQPDKILRNQPTNDWNPFKKLASLTLGIGFGRDKSGVAEDVDRKKAASADEIESGFAFEIQLGDNNFSWSLDQSQKTIESLSRQSSQLNPAASRLNEDAKPSSPKEDY